LLLDRDNQPAAPGRGGKHSHQVRIERRRVRVIRMRLVDLQGREDQADGEEAGSDDRTARQPRTSAAAKEGREPAQPRGERKSPKRESPAA
jgi:hypothetical protein